MTDEWRTLKVVHSESLNKTIVTLHKLSQYLSWVGSSYIEKADDFSHTNLGWDAINSSLIGRWTSDGVRISFNFQEFSYKLEAPWHYSIILPEDQTFGEVEELLRHLLIACGLTGSHFQPSDDYQLPYEFDSDEEVERPKSKYLSYWADCRSNADLMLHKLAAEYAGSSEVRVWPHHFDSGMVIPIEVKNDKTLKSIGVGLSIADGLSNEPYFYLNYFSKNDEKGSLVDLEDSDARTINKKHFKGYILPLSMIVSYTGSQAQYDITMDFLNRGIDGIMSYSGLTKQMV
ncbi:hypothetical protein [Marinigracilibium pacificum]|uniref:Uncharacterized protein n=1 Tax=Marinigracilibium pacificum TaxID=2729599 RepID=A0A848J4Y3_9BACT|nr:hypothetical protein [Marinigracilibium pacificum]NMM48222.1 hypothetical protein [Marinigracilibium pacificum]